MMRGCFPTPALTPRPLATHARHARSHARTLARAPHARALARSLSHCVQVVLRTLCNLVLADGASATADHNHNHNHNRNDDDNNNNNKNNDDDDDDTNTSATNNNASVVAAEGGSAAARAVLLGPCNAEAAVVEEACRLLVALAR